MDIDPRLIDPKRNEPINRLMLAINHYVSTGDHIGEGMAAPEGDKVRVLIPVNSHMEQDKADWECFRSRFDQVAGDFDTKIKDHGSQGLFRMYSFLIAENQCDELAKKLTEKPGPEGWGSMKSIIDTIL